MAKPVGSSYDVVVYGTVAWDQPRLTEHQLAYALHRDHRVLFVNPPQSVLTPLRYGVSRAALRATVAVFRRRLRTDGGVHVLTPLALPPLTHPRVRTVSQPWIRRQVGSALRRLSMRPDLVIAARGVGEGLPGTGDPFVVAIVKDWLQAGGHLTGMDTESLRQRELAAWSSADHVFAISSRLVERLGEEGIASDLMRHGSDADLAPAHALATAAPELDGLPRPVLGSVGRIDGRWALDALGVLADAYPAGTVALVGPVSPRLHRDELDRLLTRPNVRHFGAVTTADLPRWLAGFDVSLVPYLDDEWQRFASPIKIWDYLMAAKPIVATGSPALGELPDGLVTFANAPERLPELVRRALDEDTPERQAARRAYAAANTWKHRAEQVLEARERVRGREHAGV